MSCKKMTAQKTLSEASPEVRARVEAILAQILPLCKDLNVEEMGWITSYCFHYLAMKIGEERGFDKKGL